MDNTTHIENLTSANLHTILNNSQSSIHSNSMTNNSMNTINIVMTVISILVALIFAKFIASRVFSNSGLSARQRHTMLLLGLCGSGKTTLFAQLVAQKKINTRTSMQPTRATISLRAKHNNNNNNGDYDTDSSVNSSTSPFAIVDYPGHRRLRDSLTPALAEAKTIILVVDSVTIQDDKHEGAQALAELIVATFTSPAFYGVSRVLVACTKRDELTSYAAKAVRKLLEKEITCCLATRRGEVQSLDNIVNAAGVAVGRNKKIKNGGMNGNSKGGRVYELPLGVSGKFNFDDFPISVEFVDISSFVEPEKHPFNVEPVRKFAEQWM